MESKVGGVIAAPIDKVWALVGDFGNLDYFPLAAHVELIEGEAGTERIITLQGGSVGRERLIERRADIHRIDYLYVDDPAQPFSNYRASLWLEPGADGGTILHWRSTYEARPDAADAVRHFIEVDIYAACIAGLRAACE